jgi:hypothetical protein
MVTTSKVCPDRNLKVTFCNKIICPLEFSNNKQYSANGTTFILATLDKMYLHMLITYNLTAEYIRKYVDTHDITAAVTILAELDAWLLCKLPAILNAFSGAFAKLASSCLSVCLSVRPCVRMEQLGSHLTRFLEI